MLRSSYSPLIDKVRAHLLSPKYKSKRVRVLSFALAALTAASSSHSAMESNTDSLQQDYHDISRKVRIQPMMKTSALGSAAVTSIHKDRSGRLWISEQSGLYLYDGQELIAFSTMNPDYYFAPSLDISSIAEDSQGNIWTSSRSTGITKYNHNRKIFEKAPGLPESGVSQVVFVSHDTLLYIHHGAIKGFRISSRSKVYGLEETVKVTGIISSIKVVDDSVVLLFSSSGAFRLTLKDGAIERLPPLLLYSEDGPLKPVLDDKIGSAFHEYSPVEILKPDLYGGKEAHYASQRTSITAIHQGLFFAGTDDGLYIFHQDGRFVAKYHTRNSNLTNDHITFLYSDEDVLWIGTYEGLCFLKLSDFEIYDFLSDSISNEVLSFSQDQSGNIWLGTYDGIYKFDPKNMSHQSFSEISPNVDLLDNRVMALDVEGGEILIGTRKNGLSIIDLSSGSVISHDIEDNLHLEVTQILRYSETMFLVSTFNFGMYSLEKVSRGNETEYVATSVTESPITMLKSHAGNIIAANENEIFIFNSKAKTLREINVLFPLQGVQPTVTTIHSISNDSILVGTQSHGIFFVHLKDMQQSSYFAKPMLREVQSYAAAVYAVEKDPEHRLWVATSNGLFLYSGQYDLIRRYSVADGIQANKFNFGSSFRDSYGYLYFGGSRGYNRFRPNQISTSTSPPTILNRKISISNREWTTRLPFHELDSIVLNHNDRFITFEFSALDYTDPESTRYRHKLVGFDTDWIDIGNRGSATYTSLPAGDYVFRVQAVNSAGIWNYDGLAMELRVEPAPWLTWWAFALYFILFCYLVVLFLKFYRNYMLKEQQLQQANEMQRIADRFADELQDQIDFQSKLTDSIHSYNKQLLYWAKFCTDTTVEYEPAIKELLHDRILFRLGVLELVQDCLYYQGERLYANLNNYATGLINKLSLIHPHVCNRLTTVNDIQKELIPGAQAIPLAIILAELLDNSLAHAFTGTHAACFVRLSVTLTPNSSTGSDTVRLVYQDNGTGIPPGLAFESPESAGFAIIRHASEALGCELDIDGQDRGMVTARFDLAWS